MKQKKTALEFVGVSPKNAHGYAVYSYFIHEMPSGETVGDCCLRIGEGLERIGNIGYSIDEPHRNQGHATNACKRLLSEAAALGMDTVIITCEKNNIASRRVCEKLGGLLDENNCVNMTLQYKFFAKK